MYFDICFFFYVFTFPEEFGILEMKFFRLHSNLPLPSFPPIQCAKFSRVNWPKRSEVLRGWRSLPSQDRTFNCIREPFQPLHWVLRENSSYLLKVSLSSFSGFPRFRVNRRTKLTNSWKSRTPEPSTSTSLIISLTSLSVGFCPIVLNKAVSSCNR